MFQLFFWIIFLSFSLSNALLPSLATLSSSSRSHSLSSNFTTMRSLTADAPIKIVAYNTIVGYLNWHEQFFTDYISSKCHRKCAFSTDPRDVTSPPDSSIHSLPFLPLISSLAYLPLSQTNDADVVVFLASTFHRSSPQFPPKAKPSTLFVLHTMEQPMYATMLTDFQFLKQHFDLLAMYSQETIYPGSGVPNLPMTYFPLHVYQPESVLSPMKAFKDKDGYGTGLPILSPVFDSLSLWRGRCSCCNLHLEL
jgi:hypothetical protein